MNTNAEDRDINQKLHEARGLCWHENPRYEKDFIGATQVTILRCEKCGDAVDDEGLPENLQYDSDLIAAFDLVEWMIGPDEIPKFFFRIESAGAYLKEWRVRITDGGTETVGEAEDESLARAIALAAIRALEVK